MSTTCLRDVTNGCILNVRVHPGARRNAIIGIHADALKISLTTPPIEGRANDALIAFLAQELRLTKAHIILLTGLANRNKSLMIEGRSAAEVQAALLPVISC
jgi:uncharacterized protein (TIGR00251 family)